MLTKQQAQELCTRAIVEPIHQTEIEELLEYYIRVRKEQYVKISIMSQAATLHPMLFVTEMQKAVQAFNYACFWLNQNHFVDQNGLVV